MIIAFGTSGVGAQADTYFHRRTRRQGKRAATSACGLVVVGSWRYDLNTVARGDAPIPIATAVPAACVPG